jgi:hypothetical protein
MAMNLVYLTKAKLSKLKINLSRCGRVCGVLAGAKVLLHECMPTRILGSRYWLLRRDEFKTCFPVICQVKAVSGTSLRVWWSPRERALLTTQVGVLVDVHAR